MLFIIPLILLCGCAQNIRLTSNDSASISDNIQFKKRGYISMQHFIPLYNIQSDTNSVTDSISNSGMQYDKIYHNKITQREQTINYMNRIAASTSFRPSGIIKSVESVPTGNIALLQQRIDSNKSYKSDIDIDEIGLALFLHDAVIQKRESERKVDMIEDPYIIPTHDTKENTKVLGDELPKQWKSYKDVQD